MTVECIKNSTAHRFEGNPIAEQHRLRYKCLIEGQAWNAPFIDNMEYDQYDNPATVYFIWRYNKQVKGVARLYPTTKPYMLKDVFSHLVSYESLPATAKVWEGSRFCLDKDLCPKQRKQAAQELILAYLEYCLEHNIGVMVPAYWKSVFVNNGCPIHWLGEESIADDGKRVRAGKLLVNHKACEVVRNKAGIYGNVLSYGCEKRGTMASFLKL
ncbi:acyl-homoserine-lactone synthase [Pseudoalteromonas sp. S16_S37]|uniref:acyl-homoserine-lactone synthase n=1 Tax=Pseudoalteromonas sp. S16_S37 TaxID=2720228 RepID=UPI0016811E2A|nr:acyl-homoserine-lactone synthase [Pseudoalteromonas sp. S16_S37]MBD1583065.1 hypothetical protein [Pseudoalteromonas sp. S16_S37]